MKLSKSGFAILMLSVCLPLAFCACGSDSSDSGENENDGDIDAYDSDADGFSDGDGDADSLTEQDEEIIFDVPDDIPPLLDELPFDFERDSSGDAPDADEIASFTQDFTAFFKTSDFFKWLARYSQGLPENNEWNQPGYMVWWTNAYATRHENLVTISWDGPPDNSTAKVTRALAPIIGLALHSSDQTLSDLASGYIKGLSATYDGMIWGNENPVVDTIMARCIFNRNYQTELDGGRRIAVNYDSVRYEIIEQRHDTLHNPANPTWGDIYVRNKRSKDDFPYLYRDVPWLVRLIWQTGDENARAAAIKLFRQICGMAGDIVEHDYKVRTKDGDGKLFIPTLDNGEVDDFASFTNYELLFPNAECTAKLATAYLASGEKLDNECILEDSKFYGDGGGYEDMAIASHYWSSNMIQGYHLSALAVALTFGDYETARKLLEGLAARIDLLESDERAGQYSEWWPDLAQLLVLAAAYGMPLNGDEARLIQKHYLEATVHYDSIVPWDIWDASVPEDTPYSTLPDRNEYDVDGNVTKTFVRPTEILNPFEYCASPLRSSAGAQFVDCDLLMDTSRW